MSSSEQTLVMMKAVICTAYGGPHVLKVTDIEKPKPKANEVLIRIHATTVTAADFRVRSFTLPPIFWIPGRLMLGVLRPRKKILGTEISGVVESVGDRVTQFKKGDEVMALAHPGFGGYAEYITLSETGPITSKPKNVAHEQATAIPLGASTALYFLRKAAVGVGKRVLIYGAAGRVGPYAGQIAKYFGAHVTAVCSGRNLALVKSIGADVAVDYSAPEFSAGLGRYDIVFVAIDKLPFSICRRLLSKNGVYVNVTAPVMTPLMIATSIRGKHKLIMASGFSTDAKELSFLTSLVEQEVLKPVIDRVYALNEIADAHRYVETGRKRGNVVVCIQS